MKKLVLISIKLYKKTLSPILVRVFGNSCRYSPTCSEYSYIAIKKFGLLKGLRLSIKRLLKCNPFFSFGFDPVPENIN